MKTLETERLILRGWRLSDLEDFHEYAKSPHVGPPAAWAPHSSREESQQVLQAFIKNDQTWAIQLKENERVIGQVKVYPDENRGQYSARNSAKLINYALSETYWGKGYMTEAVRRVVKYAFEEIGTEVLTAFHFPDNMRSKRVLEKCGFQYEGTLEP